MPQKPLIGKEYPFGSNTELSTKQVPINSRINLQQALIDTYARQQAEERRKAQSGQSLPLPPSPNHEIMQSLGSPFNSEPRNPIFDLVSMHPTDNKFIRAVNALYWDKYNHNRNR